MADLTNEEIAELRRLHEAATPVPWCGDWDIVDDNGDPIACTDVSSSADQDGLLIIAARNALPRLLDEVERLRSMHRRVMDELDAIADTVPGDEAGPHFGAAEWHKMVLAEVERLRAEKANLRRALIASGKAVGCVLSDAVSDEFLLGVPQEVLACVAKLRAEVERRDTAKEAGRG